MEGAVQPGTVFSSIPDDVALKAKMCDVCRVLLAPYTRRGKPPPDPSPMTGCIFSFLWESEDV